MNNFKHWAFAVALLYGLILIALTCPVIAAALASEQGVHPTGVYQCWQYWVWVGVMVLCQMALLGVPVHVANQRPVSRQSIFLTVTVSGLMMGLLVFGASISIIEVVYQDKNPGWTLWGTVATAMIIWLGWILFFFAQSRREDSAKVSAKQCRGLLRGSILELLIAVPMHIIARHRNYCCAGLMTFVGITIGISVMLFAFGPAIFYLGIERWKRLHPKPKTL